MTPEKLKEWRKLHKLNQTQAALALGIGLRGYQKREAGETEITRETELACKYLSEHPEEIAIDSDFGDGADAPAR